MKLIHKNIKMGQIKVMVETLDDLWALHTILEIGDEVAGQSTRKIKIGEEGDAVRKKVSVKIAIEKIEFTGSQLRVLGIIKEGSEDVPHGSHHSLGIEPRDAITITKKHWPKYQQEKIEESCRQETAKILICILDREQATFAALKRSGYLVLGIMGGEVQKKYDGKVQTKNFYAEVQKVIDEYEKRTPFSHIVIASPAFWKEDFMKQCNPSWKGKIILATVSSSDESALREVLLRPELQQALARDRISKEQALVERFLAEVSKEGNAAYGKKYVAEAAKAGAVQILLVSELLIKESRIQGNFSSVEELMNAVEQTGGEVRLIAADHDAGKQLYGLGGVAAILRYSFGKN